MRARDAPGPRRARADGIRLRTLERAHRPARQPRRGRALRHSGDVPELVLRAEASPLRRGRLRLPGVGSDGPQRHQREDHPPARRRRALRRPLRPPAGPRARARPPRRRPAASGRMGVAGGNGRPCQLDATRLLYPSLRGGDPLRRRADRVGSARRDPVGADRQRGCARDLERSADGSDARVAVAVGGLLRSRDQSRAGAFDEAQQAPDGGRDGSHHRRPRGDDRPC